MEIIGTFGISFMDEEDWGSQTYHDNALQQLGKTVTEGVLLAQQRSPLPLPLSSRRTSPATGAILSRSNSKAHTPTSNPKKRKDRHDFLVSSDDDAKSVAVNFGLDAMSIQSPHSNPNDVGGQDRRSKSTPASSYKLYSRSVNANDLWQNGAVVFLPAKDLLKQFCCGLQMDKVEHAVKRAAKKDKTAHGQDKVRVGT